MDQKRADEFVGRGNSFHRAKQYGQPMRVSVYRLIPDPDIYHGILPRNLDDWDVFDQFVGKPIGDAWTPIPVRFEKNQQRGDFPSLMSHVPVFSERALHVLKPLVADNIEVLPLECQEEPLYAINVLDLVDCLDDLQSKVRRFPSGGIMLIEEYAFKEGSIAGHHLFKVEEAPLKGVLASNRFKSLVEQNGLLGLVFKPVG